MRRRNIFYKAVISSKENVGEKNSDMCLGISLQKIDLSAKVYKAQLGFRRDAMKLAIACSNNPV